MEQFLEMRPKSCINKLDEHGYTMLSEAAAFGNEATMEVLLKRGADTELCDLDLGGEPPLHRAIVHEHIGAIKLLITYNADMNARGWMGLTYTERIERLNHLRIDWEKYRPRPLS
jgi:ankyrin repeat protein